MILISIFFLLFKWYESSSWLKIILLTSWWFLLKVLVQVISADIFISMILACKICWRSYAENYVQYVTSIWIMSLTANDYGPITCSNNITFQMMLCTLCQQLQLVIKGQQITQSKVITRKNFKQSATWEMQAPKMRADNHLLN